MCGRSMYYIQQTRTIDNYNIKIRAFEGDVRQTYKDVLDRVHYASVVSGCKLMNHLTYLIYNSSLNIP